MGIYGNKLVNMIETKPLCISLSNLADLLTMGNPIDLEAKVTMCIIDKCEVRRDATLCVVIFLLYTHHCHMIVYEQRTIFRQRNHISPHFTITIFCILE